MYVKTVDLILTRVKCGTFELPGVGKCFFLDTSDICSTPGLENRIMM